MRSMSEPLSCALTSPPKHIMIIFTLSLHFAICIYKKTVEIQVPHITLLIESTVAEKLESCLLHEPSNIMRVVFI